MKMINLAKMEELAKLAIVNKWRLKICLREARLMLRFTSILRGKE